MSTYSALYYHLIWSTKNRTPLILDSLEPLLYKYINGIVRNNNIDLLQIGGMPDHIHLLLRSSPDKNISDLVKDIKISSSKMIQGQSLSAFAWQIGYGAFSISKSNVDKVKKYIQMQKEHHKTCSFKDEWMAFLKQHEITFNEKYVLG